MYRPKSTDVWFNLPGVVAAYQPIAAPDPFAAQQNVAHRGARFGVYTAMPGVLPTWRSAAGWTFNGSDQYLSTGWFPPGNTIAMVARYANVTSSAAGKAFVAIGCADRPNSRYLHATVNENNIYRIWRNGGIGSRTLNGYPSFGVIGLSYDKAYADGVAVTGTIAVGTIPNNPVLIGAIGANDLALPGSVLCALLVSRILSPAEMWLASRQMAFCEANPDWNAWARRRRYYYAPSQAAAAAFNPAWARNANTVLGGGFD